MKTLSLTLLCIFAFAGNAKAENAEANAAAFKNCVETESGWYERWGRYLAGYTYNSAQKYCQHTVWWAAFNVKPMGCYLKNKWHTAGYYCEDINGGE